jgi:CRISPR-associated protein Csd2
MLNNTIITDPARRHDFVLLFDVTDGNPNGDPDAGNMPRIDPETMQGLVTDVCIKRKVRNYVALTTADQPGYRIYVQDKGIYLNDLHQEAQEAVGIPKAKAKDPDRGKRNEARDWMCRHYFDVRLFGAVMSTSVNCGQVRGPMQFTFARSIDPVVPMDISVTRVALTNEKEKQTSQESEDESERGSRTGTMGRKAMVPYGLYRAHGFFSAPFAAQTGVTADDLELFWKALQIMWDHDHSAARGLMSCRGLHIFSHDDKLGSAPAQTLFERITARLNDGVDAPRTFADYTVTIHDRDLPPGVTLTTLVGAAPVSVG